MIEVLVASVMVIAANILVRPILKRRSAPRWAIVLRARGRGPVIATIWIAVVVLMGALWLIGEQRGLLNVLMLVLWVGLPLAALRLTNFLLRTEPPV